MDRHFAQLATDPDYLKNIAKSVDAGAIRTDINLPLLSDALSAFGLPDMYHLARHDGIDAEAIQGNIDAWHAKIANGPLSLEQIKALTDMWEHLAEDDGHDPEPSDCIFVFGGPETTKARKAAELYKAGKAPRIIFTGDTQRALVNEPHTSESVRDAEIAMHMGVPQEAILIEKTSINTPGNVENARTILSTITPFPTTFILVNLPWYLRRATNTFHTYWKTAPVAASRIHRINAGSEQFNVDNYFRNRRGLEYVVFEYLKMKQAREMQHM